MSGERHTLRHAALATAVKVKIEIDQIARIGMPSPSFIDSRERMQAEIDKWADTDDVYALGIMAPLHALGSSGLKSERGPTNVA